MAIGELDPLNRRLCSEKKPDVVVQVVILADDNEIRDKLAEHDIIVQTIAEVAPIEVQPARVLSHLYTYLGIFEIIIRFLLCFKHRESSEDNSNSIPPKLWPESPFFVYFSCELIFSEMILGFKVLKLTIIRRPRHDFRIFQTP